MNVTVIFSPGVSKLVIKSMKKFGWLTFTNGPVEPCRRTRNQLFRLALISEAGPTFSTNPSFQGQNRYGPNGSGTFISFPLLIS